MPPAVLALLLLLAGCGGGDGGTGPDPDDTPPTVQITAPSDGASIVEGSSVTFRGTASDDTDGSLSGESLTWDSSLDGTLGTGTSVTTSELSRGDHTITLTATDGAGNSGTASISVTVNENEPPQASISSPSQDTVAGEGGPVPLQGSATDPQAGELEGEALRWESDRDGELGTGASLTEDALSVADHTIRLVATDPQGLADTASVAITVEENGEPSATLTAPSDGTEVPEGQSVTFEGSGSDPEDGALTGASLEWTSDLDGEIGTGENFTRSDLSPGTHAIQLTARDSRRAADSVTVELVVNGAPEVSISSPSDESAFGEGQSVTLEGSATDPVDGPISGSALEWSSDRDGSLGTGGTVTVSDLSPGPHALTLTATDTDGNVGTASIQIVVESPGFDIRLKFQEGLSQSQRDIVREALKPWTNAITGDLEPGFLPESQQCLTDSGGVDDLLVVVRVASVDGTGGTLAFAGPCFVRTDASGAPTLPISGVVTFDEADLGNAQLPEIVTHEVGHVLGVGITFLEGWGANAMLSDSRDPFFSGPQTVESFRETLDGQAYLSDGVPLENTGGAGTQGAHWREPNFDNELMTGFINPGRPNPLSVVTLASMRDIGYEVDLSAAESYTLPMPQIALLEAEADATLSRPNSSGENFGDPGTSLGKSLVVGANDRNFWSGDPASEIFTGLIRFDIPDVPAGVTFRVDSLQLFTEAVTGDSVSRDVEVLQVTESWAESTVTWDSRPAFGAAVDTFPHDQQDPGLFTSALGQLVRDWASGAVPNHGLALRAPAAESDTAFSVGFATRDAAAVLRPRIVVTGRVQAGGVAALRAGGDEKIPLGNDIRTGEVYQVDRSGEIVRVLQIPQQ